MRTKFAQGDIRKHLGFINSIALSFHHTTGIDFDELYSEACFAWLANIKYWDPSKGKANTYMMFAIRTKLQYLRTREKDYGEPLKPIDVIEYETYAPDNFMEMISPDFVGYLDLFIKNETAFCNLGSRKNRLKDIQKVLQVILLEEKKKAQQLSDDSHLLKVLAAISKIEAEKVVTYFDKILK